MNKVKILLVVEGSRTETRFFERLAETYELNFEIHVFNTNIYTLYQEMKKIDFEGDLKDVLLSYQDTPENRARLDQRFAYTYLIFDFDPHHRRYSEKETPLEEVMTENIQYIEEMAAYFDNETDPTKGKLYINYPMMESYKDCDAFFDADYAERFICINDVPRYKRLVGMRRNANIRIDRYEKHDFEQLTKMNVFKLNRIVCNSWSVMSYEAYRMYSGTVNILEKEKEFVISEQRVGVLNTTLFLLLDYFGNRNGLYDHIVFENGTA